MNSSAFSQRSRLSLLVLFGLIAVVVLARLGFKTKPSDASHIDRLAANTQRMLSTDPEAPQHAMQQFNEWSQRYAAANEAEKAAMKEQGVALAKARRPEFFSLITEDPERALQEAVPMVVRQALPASVVAQLEQRVNGTGQLRTYMNTPLPGQAAPKTLRYLELTDGTTYQAHTFGREENQVQWKIDRSSNGVAMTPPTGSGMPHIALNPRPVRPLELGEIPDPAVAKIDVCPVSDKSTALPPGQASAPITEQTPAVEANGTIVYLCDGSHTVIYEEQLARKETVLQGEGSTGGAIPFSGLLPHALTKSLGVLRTLYIPVTFPDENKPPTTDATAQATMKDVADFYTASSYGKLTIATTITPCLMMPHNGRWYQDKDKAGEIDGLGLTHSDARAAAKAAGYDPALFDCIILLMSGDSGYGISRAAGGWGGGNSVWVYDPAWRSVVAHEMGHTFDLAHANFWNTNGASAIGSGSSQEYGDEYDVMGGGAFPSNQFNIGAKDQIKWLSADNLTSVTESGTYRIYAQDASILDPKRRYGLKIAKDLQRTYYAQVRQLYDGDANEPWLKNGIQLIWKWPGNGGSNDQLIDTTPGSPNGKKDGNIVVGRTFSDHEAGIHFTPVAVNSGDQKSVDVVVNVGNFPGNQAPTLTLNTSATNVPVGTTVTFNAVANDADGDALAYYWNYGNADKTVLPNTSSITRTFSSTGQYWVACTVSDMKGKATMRYAVINVGSPTTFTLGGRVTNGGQAVANIPVSTSGSREVFTDSDGYYTLTGLTAGSYVVTPRLEGYTFDGSLPSPISVGPNVSNANFSATAGTLLTLAASTPTATEGGTSGKFTLSRTGPTTSALAVSVQSLSGTATLTTDYTLSPAVASNTLTIPAGQASLDVTVNPVNDTAAEGPETVRLLLLPNSAYAISGAGEATVTLNDNDTTLPKVSIVANKAVTIENDAQAGQFTVSRTGATTAALTVNYTVSGTANSGSDFPALAGSVSIPVGSSSAVINLATSNDSVSEANETVILTLASSANYIIDSSKNPGTATIVDDDQQIVTASTVDAIATEGANPADNGTFIVTRNGDISQPLTVYYSFAGSALHGVDYLQMPGSVVIPAGQANAAITIEAIDDGIGEVDETVTILLASLGSSYKLGNANISTLTIKNAATNLPVIAIAAADSSCAEPSDNGKLRFAINGNNASPITVNYTVSGTASAGSDYTALPGTVTIPAGTGNRTVDVTVAPLNDAISEDLETIVVTLASGSGYQTWATTSTATMWLYDDEQPTVFVDASNAVPTEAGTASKFYVRRTGSTTASLVVNYTLGGTATNGSDYSNLSGSVTIPAGAASVDVIVTPTNDSTIEGTESIVLSLAAGSYSRSPLSATLYLQDNETPATQIAFNAPGSNAMESAGTVDIPVSLSAASASPVTVNYVVGSTTTGTANHNTSGRSAPYWVRLVRSGSSITAYYSPNGTTWSIQGSTQTIGMGDPVLAGLSLASNNSSASTATATFDNVTITPAGGSFTTRDIGAFGTPGSYSSNSGTYTLSSRTNDIWGNEDSFFYAYQTISGDCTITARVVSITGGTSWTKAGVMIRENANDNARHGMMCLTPSNGTAFQWRQGTATTSTGSGVDFALAAGTLTFPAGTTTQNIPLAITNDTFVESPENVVVSLRNANNAAIGSNSTHTLTILDDDAPPATPNVGFASQAASGAEASGSANILVSLSSPSADSVTVNYAVTGGTASSSSDFTLTSGTLTFAPGETAKPIPNTLSDDATAEPDETLIVTLSDPTEAVLNANSTHTFTILNDDTPAITIAASDATATEGPSTTDTGTFTITRSGSTANALTVNFTVSGSATSATDYTSIGTSVIIPAGQASQNVIVTPLDNSTGEPSETVIATLASGSGYTIGSPNNATITVADDDLPIINIAASDAAAGEAGPDAGTFTITRTGSTTGTLTVNFGISGTATSGSDFSAIGTSVNFAAGEASKNITLTPINDLISEGTEYALVSLTTNANYGIGSASFASINIADDDNAPVVEIVSPLTESAVINSGTGLMLEAQASDDGTPSPLTVTWSKVSGAGTVTFGTPNSTQTTATFSANGIYVLRITAYDGSLSSTDDVTVSVGGSDALAVQNIGSSVSNGAYSLNEATGVHTLEVRSGDTWGSADSFRYAFERVTGDVTVTARVTGVTNTASWAKAAVMIRESLQQGSAHAQMAVTPGNGTSMQWRDATNGGSGSNSTAGTNAPYWVRMVRSGNTLTGYHSPDGTNWTQQSTRTITMASEVYVGLSLCSNNTSSTCTATFDNFSVTPIVNKGAVVNAGVDQVISTNTFNLAGNVTDDGKPVPAAVTTQWNQVSGPGTASFDDPAAVSTAVTFPAPGDYVLRLVANDGWVKTYDEIAIETTNIVVNLTANDANAAEAGNDPGQFTITRSGSINGDLTVYYTIGGTAANGSDYTNIGGSVVIPNGQTDAIVTIAPVNDTVVELGGESVTLTLQQNAAYGIGSSDNDTIAIADDDIPPVISITGPATNNVSIPSGVGLVLEASTQDDGYPSPTTTTWSKVSGPGTVTFGNANEVNTTALFSVNGTYVIRLTAYDGSFSTTSDITVVAGASASSMTGYLYGAATTGSHTPLSSTSYTLSGASIGIDNNGAADGFYLLGRTFSGDFDIKSRVVSGTNISGTSQERAGLIVRQGTSGNATEISGFVGFNNTPDETGYWIRRTTNPGTNSRTQFNDNAKALPSWCRLTRSGNTVRAYFSEDGVNWGSAAGTMTITGDVRAGLCYSSDSTTSGSATFDNVSGFDSGNIGPMVNANIDKAVNLPASANLAGSASDDGKPVPATLTTTWSKASGPGTVTFGNASATSTTANFYQTGSYVLRLTASDGEIKTFDDMVVTATGTPANVAPAFTSDPMTKPDASEDSAYAGQSLAGAATDGNTNETLTYSKVSGPAWLNVAADGTLSGTPSNSDVGANSFTVRVTDSTSLTDEAVLNINVTNVNDAPVFASNPINKADVAIAQSYTGQTLAGAASDDDAGDTLTYSKVSGPAWLSVASNGALSGTPSNSDVGANSFTVRVTDLANTTADATLNINVITTNGVWTNLAGGSWPAGGNWSSSLIANGTDKTADFSTLNLTADATVTLDGARTLGGMTFSDTTPSNNWTLNTGSSGVLTLDVTSGSPTITVNNQTATLGAALAGSDGLTKAGAGTLVLSGTNTYTGGTIVSAGTLQYSAANLASLQGATSIAAGATVHLQNAATTTTVTNSFTGTGKLQLTLSAAGTANTTVNGITGFNGTVQVSTPATTGNKWNVNGVNAPNVSVVIDNNTQLYVNTAASTFAGIQVQGTGNTENRGAIRLAANLSGPVTLMGSTTIGTEGGTLSGGITTGIAGTSTLTLGTANSTDNATLSGVIGNGTGTLAMIKTAGGTLTLSGTAANTYTGTTTVSGGTLNLNKTAGVNAVTGNLVLSGGTLTLGAANQIADTADIAISGAGVISSGLTDTVRNLSVSINSGDTAKLNFASGTNFSVNSLSLTSSIAGGFVATNSHSLATGSANSTLHIGSGGWSMNDFTFALSQSTANTATVNLSGNFTGTGTNRITAGVSAFNANANINLQSATRNFAITDGATTVDAKLVNGGLNKTGAGTLTLTHTANGYTGATTVDGGTLVIAGSLANTPLTVNNTGTLAGSGTLGGATTVAVGGTLAPGSSGIGTLVINNTLALNGSTAMEISKSGVTLTADKTSGVSTLTYGGTLSVTKLGADALVAGDTFTLFSATSYSGSFSSLNLPTLTSDLKWDTSKLNVNGTLAVIALKPVELWQQAKFGNDANNAAIAGLNADPDGDGIRNTLEYALNNNPNAKDAASLPTTAVEGGNLTLTYRKNLAATDVTYVVEESTTMGTWTTAAVSEEIVSDDGFTRVIKASVAKGAAPAKFLRLSVAVAP